MRHWILVLTLALSVMQVAEGKCRGPCAQLREARRKQWLESRPTFEATLPQEQQKISLIQQAFETYEQGGFEQLLSQITNLYLAVRAQGEKYLVHYSKLPSAMMPRTLFLESKLDKLMIMSGAWWNIYAERNAAFLQLAESNPDHYATHLLKFLGTSMPSEEQKSGIQFLKNLGEGSVVHDRLVALDKEYRLKLFVYGRHIGANRADPRNFHGQILAVDFAKIDAMIQVCEEAGEEDFVNKLHAVREYFIDWVKAVFWNDVLHLFVGNHYKAPDAVAQKIQSIHKTFKTKEPAAHMEGFRRNR